MVLFPHALQTWPDAGHLFRWSADDFHIPFLQVLEVFLTIGFFPCQFWRNVPFDVVLTKQSGSDLPIMVTIELSSDLIFNWLQIPVSIDIAISKAFDAVSVFLSNSFWILISLMFAIKMSQINSPSNVPRLQCSANSFNARGNCSTVPSFFCFLVSSNNRMWYSLVGWRWLPVDPKVLWLSNVRRSHED